MHTDLAQEEQVIRKALDDSIAAWNRADLNEFMVPYAADARFVTSKGITTGSAAILARYKKKYSNPQLMGKLSLAVQTVTFNPGPNPTAATVIARWEIVRRSKVKGAEVLAGETLIVFHKRPTGWLIVEDHSS